jgi:segregation and condensation protein A
MTERSVPWWRRALTVALDGFRSGFGLFRRNGKTAPDPEVGRQTEAVIEPLEAERDETQAQKEESRVKPSSPHFEPAAAKEVVAPKSNVQPSDEPSVEAQDVKGHDFVAAQALEVLKGHDFSRGPTSATDAGALAPEASPSIADLETPLESKSPDEPAAPTPAAGETTRVVQTASAEEMTELLEIASPSVPDPPEPPKPPPLPVPDPLPAPPVTEPPGPDPLPAPVPIDDAPTLPFPEKPQRTTAEKVAAALKSRGEDADQSPFSVIVNQVYDGPLDLLLDLIRKQDIDIYDIPIAQITAQFLAYVDQLRAGDMDVAGDFIYTAALLIHIKSRMLLPRAPSGLDDAEDPRRELVDRLLEHERFKNAAQMLHEKQMLEAASWSNPGIREFQEDLGAEPEIAADTTDLVRVFSDILERARNRPILNLEEDSVTVGQMIQFLARRLTMEDKPVALRRMLSHTKSERALIAMFLALLELVRLQAILLRQDRQFSEIFIKKQSGFDALMNQGLANARDDWR